MAKKGAIKHAPHTNYNNWNRTVFQLLKIKSSCRLNQTVQLVDSCGNLPNCGWWWSQSSFWRERNRKALTVTERHKHLFWFSLKVDKPKLPHLQRWFNRTNRDSKKKPQQQNTKINILMQWCEYFICVWKIHKKKQIKI